MKDERRFQDKLRKILLFVFDHVEEIYIYHKQYMLSGFRECIDNPKELGRLFTEHKDAIKERYIKFCLKYNLARDVASQYSSIFSGIQSTLNLKMEVLSIKHNLLSVSI